MDEFRDFFQFAMKHKYWLFVLLLMVSTMLVFFVQMSKGTADAPFSYSIF